GGTLLALGAAGPRALTAFRQALLRRAVGVRGETRRRGHQKTQAFALSDALGRRRRDRPRRAALRAPAAELRAAQARPGAARGRGEDAEGRPARAPAPARRGGDRRGAAGTRG